MARIILLAAPALLACAGFTQAQYYHPAAAPGDPQTLVSSWYRLYLGREADPATAGWVRSLRRGHSPEQVLSTILSSEEYYTRAGRTKPGFIRQLYIDLLGRAPLPAEIDYWMGRSRFESRKDIAYQILVRHPRDWSGLEKTPPPYAPGYYPEPDGTTPRDPRGTYFRGLYSYYYEYRRPVGVFPPRP
jgi:hypothetical protein